MTAIIQKENVVFISGLVIMMAVVTLLTPMIVSAHGGKTHTGTQFSHLQILQKATQLYNQLVSNGKLSEKWELKLKQVDIASRKGKTGTETFVSFTRSEGDPSTVFFYFNEDGKYAGSNFTGE